MALYIGTSGWAYKEWKPDFYPSDLPQTRFLQHYSSLLSACEINATFYRLQSPPTVGRWAEATGDDFRFAIKAHRGLTHTKSVGPDDDKLGLLSAFLDSLTPLKEKLGVVLFQYPPYRRRDDAGLGRLLDALPEDRAIAFEFRHESWAADDVVDRLSERAAVCISNTDGRVPETLPPGPLAYARLRTDRYDPDARSGWLQLLQGEARERDIYAFAKHEGIPAGDPFGGVGLAQWLATNAI